MTMQRARLHVRDSRRLSIGLLLSAALASPAVFAQDTEAEAPVAAAVEPAPPAGVLEKVRATGRLTLGYYEDARPLSYSDAGNPAGYAVELCRKIGAEIQAELKLPNLDVVFVTAGGDRFDAVSEGRIDLLCGPAQPTLSRRAKVSFSIPILASGTGALMRKDGSEQLRDALLGRERRDQPVWRGQPGIQAFQERTFAVVAGTTSERYANERRAELKVNSVIASVPDLTTGIEQVKQGRADVFFADRAVLLDAAASDDDLVVLDRIFDYEVYALALGRDDEDLRLLVDRTLSRLYRSGDIAPIYSQYFGESAATQILFRMIALPE
jgi:polar amino acid transport system substrate-binding protein